MDKVKVVICDAQYLIRLGLVQVLSEDKRLECIAECTDSDELREVLKENRPDIVTIDYAQTDYFTLEDIKFVKEQSPKTKIMVISSDENSNHIFEALSYGAISFLTKECDKEEIINALLVTSKSEKFICGRIIDIIIHNKLKKNADIDCRLYNLSLREIEIIQLTAKGFSAKEIAAQLFLSPHTVYTHKKNIMKKLSLGSSSEMVMFAIKNGIIQQQ